MPECIGSESSALARFRINTGECDSDCEKEECDHLCQFCFMEYHILPLWTLSEYKLINQML